MLFFYLSFGAYLRVFTVSLTWSIVCLGAINALVLFTVFPLLLVYDCRKVSRAILWACSSITHLNAAVWHWMSLRAPGSSIYYTETHRWRLVERREILGTCVASKSELLVRVSDFWLFSADALMHHLSWALWSDSC